MNRALLVLAAALGLAAPAAAQTLAQLVAAAPDGTLRLSYAARDGVCGNGAGNISFDCRDGTSCGRHNVRNDADWEVEPSACEAGPVRLSLTVTGGRVTRLRTYVGGRWRGGATGATDLGTVPAVEAARWLLALARSGADRAASEAVLAVALADSVTVWPDLVRLARDESLRSAVRRQAVFWLGLAAGEAATRDLAELVGDDALDRDIREQAVFALSQQPGHVGVPALLQVARANRDPEVRRKAFFWLGQSRDPRALALFEEVLTRP